LTLQAIVLARGRLAGVTEGARVSTLPWVRLHGSSSRLGHLGGPSGSGARWQGERLGGGLESWRRLLGRVAQPGIELEPGIWTARR
jgi:hypothetical protein